MAGIGRFTGWDLSDITALSMPWTEMDGQLRPIFSSRAAKLSLELAATAYDLEMAPWREAGWRDFSYQVDNKLFTGAALNMGSSRIGGVISEYFQKIAHARIKRTNPISQLRGALRQREESDTCKAVVMLHPSFDGHYIVAIGFMGTGKRIYDWFSNFRLAREEGVHKGFLQLAQEFEENENEILFPQTARELGLHQLTLADILDECRRPGSRFKIWLAGHSQGGAVMQLYALREIQSGLLRQNLIGYGFASPSVIYENQSCDLSGIPLYHLINSDDVTPRVGAALHAGRCQVMIADDEMRRACYQPAWSEPGFQSMLLLLRALRDTKSGLVWTLGLLHALEDLPDEESIAVLSGFLGQLLPEKWMSALGGRLDEMIRMLIRKTERAYMLSSGELIAPRGNVYYARRQVGQMIVLYGARRFVKMLLQGLSMPHRLRINDATKGMAAYTYMVCRRFDEMKQMIWCGYSVHFTGKRHAAPKRKRPGGRFAILSDRRNQRMCSR